MTETVQGPRPWWHPDIHADRRARLLARNRIQSAIRAHPQDPELWTGFGNALVDHNHMLTPAARVAFARAIALAPNYPGPRFFFGRALLRSGDRAGALEQWRTILAKAPPKASWRATLEAGIALAIAGPA